MEHHPVLRRNSSSCSDLGSNFRFFTKRNTKSAQKHRKNHDGRDFLDVASTWAIPTIWSSSDFQAQPQMTLNVKLSNTSSEDSRYTSPVSSSSSDLTDSEFDGSELVEYNNNWKRNLINEFSGGSERGDVSSIDSAYIDSPPSSPSSPPSPILELFSSLWNEEMDKKAHKIGKEKRSVSKWIESTSNLIADLAPPPHRRPRPQNSFLATLHDFELKLVNTSEISSNTLNKASSTNDNKQKGFHVKGCSNPQTCHCALRNRLAIVVGLGCYGMVIWWYFASKRA